MKLILENWRGFVNEAELKYSETLFNTIYNIASDAYEEGKEKRDYYLKKELDVPGHEIFYSDKIKIKNGAALFYMIHGDSGLPWQNGMRFMKDNWDPKSGLKEEILKPFLERPLKITLVIDREMDSMGRMGTFDKGQGLFLALNPWEHRSWDQLRSTIRHELQHLTQRLNTYALKYGEDLFKANGDTSQIQQINLNFKKDFGTGKQKTGLRQVTQKAAREQGIGDDERMKRYLGDDFEYETWMSDILDDLVRWLMSTEIISPAQLSMINYKEQNPNILQEQDNIQKRKNIIQLAKIMKKKPADVVKTYKKMPSFNTLATQVVSLMFRSDKDLEQFAKDSNMPDYVKAIKTLKKLRPKEFAGDLVKNLELRLKKMAK